MTKEEMHVKLMKAFLVKSDRMVRSAYEFFKTYRLLIAYFNTKSYCENDTNTADKINELLKLSNKLEIESLDTIKEIESLTIDIEKHNDEAIKAYSRMYATMVEVDALIEYFEGFVNMLNSKNDEWDLETE
jgi:hypothetical protein